MTHDDSPMNILPVDLILPSRFIKALGIEKSELGPCIHRSMRKHTLTKAAAAAWILISMPTFHEAWLHYVEIVWKELDNFDPNNYRILLSQASTLIDRKISLEHVALYAIFDLFTDTDWAGCAILLKQEAGYEE